MHSCGTALLKITDKWMEAIDMGLFVGTVFLDLRKAFDLVNHDVLVEKLRIYGLSNSSLEWFQSYMSDRTQCSQINGVLSHPSKVVCGVPQGSILGPLLFLVYINDMGLSLKYCMYDMYADDTTFYVMGKNINEINDKLTVDMCSISNWCKANKMVMNTNKTKTMLIGSQQRLPTLNDVEKLSVEVNGCVLANVELEKLLGVYIDPRLSWNTHIDHVYSV